MENKYSSLNIQKLNTLDELEENLVENEQSQEKATFHLIVDLNNQQTKSRETTPISIISDRKSKYTNSKKFKNLKSGSKKRLQDSSLTSFNSLSINDEYQSIPELKTIDYDKLTSNNHGDLAKLKFTNDLEKYLILRIYSNINKLSFVLSEMDSIDLNYFLNTPDQNDCLPLYYAIKAECLNSIKLLLSKGASLERTTKLGDPAIHLACLLGVSTEILEFLLSFKNKIDYYKKDQEGWTILHCACNQGNLEIVKYLLESKHMNPNAKDSFTNSTGLHLAVINNRLNVLEYFLKFDSMKILKKADDCEIKIKKLNLNKNGFKIEPLIEYKQDEFSPIDNQFSIYKNFCIDLNSRNNEGHNLVHLASKYGRYDVLDILLKKYGSNQIDLNLVDFKNRTSLDLAWQWLIDFYEEEEDKSIFYDDSNSYYIQRKNLITDSRIDLQVKILFLLSKYGAKFSSFKVLLYDLDKLKELDESECDLPYDLFYPKDHVSFNKIKLQSKFIVSIQAYLKCLLYVLKFDLSTMFLKKRFETCAANNDSISESNFDSLKSFDTDLGSVSIWLKKELNENLQCLLKFINQNCIDTFEKNFYFESIQIAFKLLSKY